MKLKQRQNIISHGGGVEEIGKYSICEDSMDVIFDILRSRMYASPIRAIMQEVASNARDANREAGRADRPIEVKLPSVVDQSFYIRDFGPGITPHRMSNVFLKYGASTKRDSNEQTGGFGLGAKTPFSYSDTFTITSITDMADETGNEGDRGVLVKRQYVAMIEETRRGRIDLVMVSDPDEGEEQGTTIGLNCKKHDESTFQQWLINTCKHWDVKPVVKGVNDFKWQQFDTIFCGHNWSILEREKNRWGGVEMASSKPYALVDGIPYIIKSEYIFGSDTIQPSMKNLFNFPLRIKFNVGEIELSSTREDIQYTQSTINRIKVRLYAVIEELKKLMKEKIAKSENLWEAHLEWRQLCNIQDSILEECSWKNCTVNNHFIGNIQRDYKGIEIKQFKKQQNNAPKMKRVFGWDYIGGPGSSVLVLDDTGNIIPSKNRIITLFNDNPNLDMIWTITVSKWDNGEDKSSSSYESAQMNWDKLNKKFNLDQMGMIKLSKVEPTKTPRGKSLKNTSTPIVIKKFNNNRSYGGYNVLWEDTAPGEIKLNDSGRVYVILYDRTEWMPGTFNMTTKIGRPIGSAHLKKISNEFGKTIYGVPFRYANKLGNGWIALDAFLKKERSQLIVGRDNFSKEVEDGACAIDRSFSSLWGQIGHQLSSFLNFIDDKNGFLVKYINLSNKIRKYTDVSKQVNIINDALRDQVNTDQITSGDSEIRKMNETFKKRYPLLLSINTWEWRNIPISEIAFYINAKDKAK